jgi:hypothetical protein
LQLDASGQGATQYAGGGVDIVREAACDGDLAEQWVNTYNSGDKATEFVSEWAAENGTDANSGNVCLGAAAEVDNAYIGACEEAPADQWSAEWVS